MCGSRSMHVAEIHRKENRRRRGPEPDLPRSGVSGRSPSYPSRNDAGLPSWRNRDRNLRMTSLCLPRRRQSEPGIDGIAGFASWPFVMFTVRTETGLSTTSPGSRGKGLGRRQTGATHGMRDTPFPSHPHPHSHPPGRSETSADPASSVLDINAQMTIPGAPSSLDARSDSQCPGFGYAPPRLARGFLTPAPDHQMDPNLPSPQSKTPGGETEFPREVNSCRGRRR